MKKKMRFLLGIWLLLFVLAANGKAQDFKPEAEIIGSSEKIVDGSPFSAEAINESVQILFDGNKITRTVKSQIFRDSQGRFRRDEMPKPVGIGSFIEMPEMILILDPIAGIKFYLDPKSKTFRQSVIKDDFEKMKQKIENQMQEVEKQMWEVEKQKGKLETRRAKDNKQRQQIEKEFRQLEKEKQQLEKEKLQLEKNKRESEKPRVFKIPDRKQTDAEKTASANSSATAERSAQASITTNGVVQTKSTEKKAANQPKTAAKPNKPNNPSIPVLSGGEEKKESLGKRKIEGIEAEGTRLTRTIAAGAIGNERAFEIVYERWYSEDLQLIVFSKYSDPRFGEQTYRLTNIKLVEPDTKLFKVPSDFKIGDKQWKIQDKPEGNREKRGEPTKRKP